MSLWAHEWTRKLCLSSSGQEAAVQGQSARGEDFVLLLLCSPKKMQTQPMVTEASHWAVG